MNAEHAEMNAEHAELTIAVVRGSFLQEVRRLPQIDRLRHDAIYRQRRKPGNQRTSDVLGEHVLRCAPASELPIQQILDLLRLPPQWAIDIEMLMRTGVASSSLPPPTGLEMSAEYEIDLGRITVTRGFTLPGKLDRARTQQEAREKARKLADRAVRAAWRGEYRRIPNFELWDCYGRWLCRSRAGESLNEIAASPEPHNDGRGVSYFSSMPSTRTVRAGIDKARSALGLRRLNK